MLIVVLLVALYGWEYYCVTRPEGQCGKICEMRFEVMGQFHGRDIRYFTCYPWYHTLWK